MRLGISSVHGIGVFAIRLIPRGTNIFANDLLPLRWIESEALAKEDLSPAEARLYHDFGVEKDGWIVCPTSFNYLTPGWYLNEPAPDARANVTADAELNFIARRDIQQGEELTILYAELSGAVPPHDPAD